MKEVDKLAVLEGFLTGALWFADRDTDYRLTGVSIKVEPAGFLFIVKAITAEGPKVAFSSETDLDGFRRKMLDKNGLASLRWREDKFKLDKKT